MSEINIQPELSNAIRYMAKLSEFHVRNVGFHVERIHSYCYIVSKGMGFPDEEALLLAHASQLHDVGMVGVPEAILKKKGELSHSDWEIIKQHPEIGHDILSPSPQKLFQLGATIALTHHERWDGSGYPHGLKGKDIPLEGQICAIADVFEALTTERPYGDKATPKQALSLIEEAGGLFFDPDVVEVFSKQAEDIFHARQRSVSQEKNTFPAIK